MNKVYLEEVDSTNLYAKQNIADFQDGTIIHALSQTCGRGRFERKWIDFGKGNLFLTFVLKPSSDFKSLYSNLTQYLSVKLCKLLENEGLTPQVKWPNDVLINGKKIAGILSETVMSGSVLKGIVLGIGVNLSASEDQVSAIKERKVTALNLELNKTPDLELFRDNLCFEFFKDYNNFLSKGFIFIKDDYISRACFLNKKVCVKVFNKEVSGEAVDVTDNGELVLLSNGEKSVLTIGDIL